RPPLGSGSPGKKFPCCKCHPGTHGKGTSDRLPYCSVSLPCHGPKLFRFALVEGSGRRGRGVVVSWHGAAPNEKFIQIAMTNIEMSAAVWLQIVSNGHSPANKEFYRYVLWV